MNFKKILFSILAVFMLVIAVACGKKEAPTEDANAQQEAASEVATQDYHIGIVTTSVSQSEDNFRGAEAVLKQYGSSNDEGGKITVVTIPDNFMQEQETTISQMVSLADDPDMKAIVVAEGIPGTYPAFKAIREKRPDILLIVNNTHEDPIQVSSVADVVVNSDSVARGYLIVKTAHDLGATKFMHISFPRHLSYETISRRRAIMEQTAKDLGMEYIEMSAPDPLSDVGVPGAQQFILEQVPNWIAKYGKDIAFFATNDAQTEPLLKQIAAHGGCFIEADLPSPTMGYPGALGIEFTDDEKGNWPKILEKVEKAVVAAIKKAGINANLVDSEDHIESNIKKGWLTREEADKAIEIRNTVAAEKAANLNEDMIQNIAKGRLNKFFKENCLVDQEFQFGDGDKQSVSEWLKAQSKDLKIVDYKRFTLAAE